MLSQSYTFIEFLCPAYFIYTSPKSKKTLISSYENVILWYFLKRGKLYNQNSIK